MEREERIRRRAYDIWCAEGWPKGRDKEHWEQARNEVDAQTDAVRSLAAPKAEDAQVSGDLPWLRLLEENFAHEPASAAGTVASQRQRKPNNAAVGRHYKLR